MGPVLGCSVLAKRSLLLDGSDHISLVSNAVWGIVCAGGFGFPFRSITIYFSNLREVILHCCCWLLILMGEHGRPDAEALQAVPPPFLFFSFSLMSAI